MIEMFTRSMTLVVPSRHGGATLNRLLAEVEGQVLRAPPTGRGLNVLVVLDGSEVRSPRLPRVLGGCVGVAVMWQEHQGLAAARNRGLARSSGDIVWFLDDDEVPADGAVRAHRSRHEATDGVVVVGPNILLRDGPADARARGWFEQRHAMLAASGSIRSFDQFSAANMSGPAELFRGLGGFDERFVGWGYEDLEFGYRLLERGAQILFAPDAGALHDGPARSITELATRARQGGRNLSLLVDLHPGTATVLLPERSWTRRLLRVLTSSRPQVAMAVLRVLARVLLTAASVEWAVGRGTSDALVELLKRVCAMEGLLARTIEAQVPRGSRVG